VNNRKATEELLDDVFANDVGPALDTAKRMARRRRTARHARVIAPVVLALVLGTWFIRTRHHGEQPDIRSAASAVAIVTSLPLSAELVVNSAPGGVVIVDTSGFYSFLTTSENAPTTEIIDDERLLELAPGAILVRINAGAADLVFPMREEASSQKPVGSE
jgi:hypothetical protein